MARFPPQWLDSPASYSSQYDRALLMSLFPVKAVRGMTPTVVGSTMQIAFGAGAAASPLYDGLGSVHLATDGVSESVTLATAPASGYSRIDSVVARFRMATEDWIWAVNQGTAVTGTPVAPGPTASSAAGVDIPICDATVVGGSASISQANIADRRPGMATGVRYPARMYCTTAWPTSYNPIAFNGTSYDPYGCVTLGAADRGGAYYACPVNGYYLCSGGFSSSSSGVGSLQVGFTRNGVQVSETGLGSSTAAGNYSSMYLTDVIPCSAGDHLQMFAMAGATQATFSTGGAASLQNFFTVILEGPA